MRFADRADAGRRLGVAVRERAFPPPLVVLGIARGGVVVAEAVADALGAPLDVVVPRKVGAPGNPELGIGAVAPGVRVLDRDAIERLHVSSGYLDREISHQEAEIARRERAYRGDRSRADLHGATAIVVDDGIATGGTASAALRWARNAGAARVVLAVPVAPAPTLGGLRREANGIVVLGTPSPFYAVGEWYDAFDQTSDEEVVEALARARDHAA
jgi:predicted phosphoribosyltransferase